MPDQLVDPRAVGSTPGGAPQGPTTTEFFDFFFGDNAGRPQDDFRLFFQWNVTGGSVDLVGGVGPGVFGAPPEQPLGRYVDLGGSTGDPGRFETLLAYPMIAGQTYNFTFDYRSTGGDFNTATALVGGRSYTVSTASTSFQRFSVDFVATTTEPVRIVFQGDENDRDNSGVGIDGVLFGTVIPLGGGNGVVLNGTEAADYRTGGAGADTISGFGGDDTLLGGAGADVISGNQGRDLIFGNAGADQIFGGQGDDTIYAGKNSDVVNGDLGADLIYGDLDDDVLQGGAGADTLLGGAGIDNLIGGADDDQLFGNEGIDTLTGGDGRDTLYGGKGNDSLQGDAGDDILFGDLGDDVLVGGAGQDRLTGGAGADTFRYLNASDSTAAASDTITDFQSGVDRLDLSALRVLPTDSFTITASGGVSTVTVQSVLGVLASRILVEGTISSGDVLFG